MEKGGKEHHHEKVTKGSQEGGEREKKRSNFLSGGEGGKQSILSAPEIGGGELCQKIKNTQKPFLREIYSKNTSQNDFVEKGEKRDAQRKKKEKRDGHHHQEGFSRRGWKKTRACASWGRTSRKRGRPTMLYTNRGKEEKPTFWEKKLASAIEEKEGNCVSPRRGKRKPKSGNRV